MYGDEARKACFQIRETADMQVNYSMGGFRQSNPMTDYSVSSIRIVDNFLDDAEQGRLFNFLNGPGWGFGASSDSSAEASRYWFKHFAGQFHGADTHPNMEADLAATAPPVSSVWTRLKASALAGHQLTRCYANGYPYGSEGAIHIDANHPDHFTALYYPHLSWSPNFAGETVFFDRSQTEIIASVYPRPNRLVIFPGMMPHIARGVSRRFQGLRITLMFKSQLSAV